MERPVKFDAWVRPSCLPSFGEVENVEKAIATGWGRVDWGIWHFPYKLLL